MRAMVTDIKNYLTPACKIILRAYLCIHNSLRGSLIEDKSESSSAGRARPCQGRGREFESRLPLKKALEKGLFHFRTS